MGLRYALAWLRQVLGVPQAAPWWQWVWRALVLPPEQRPQGWPLLAWLGRHIATVLRAVSVVFNLILEPLRITLRGLDALAALINKPKTTARIERSVQLLMRYPSLRWLSLGLAMVAAVIVMTTPFNWFGQLLFFIFAWALSLVVRRLPGRFPALALAAISLLATGRYAWWRVTTTLEFETLVQAILGYGLLAAEAYTWLIVVLGFIQTAWPLKRAPAPLQGAAQSWPTVDVFIPTYNEPLSVVRPTVLAAMALDWPADRFKVYLLDDGRREEFRAFAAEVGVQYIIRPDNHHAKAGNLNHALQKTDGELVAIFDCDHLPTRSFLKTAVGWFQCDPKCAMLQTPHHFFSPDPFERNLGTFRRVPNEGALFYGLIQDGNDFWNATFFCGSCAVIRREPLMEVGGIAVETVTEDAHTALKLHRRGYTTAYINEAQAAGLATESLSAHVGQRIRWARGMAQIFRTDNPLLGKGLTLWQRICYSNAMLHFFFGLPRLVFLTAPMAYLFFHIYIIHAHAFLLALYVLPYIVQAGVANAHVQGKYRHTFWAEVYETVLAWYVALPTTLAIINPKLGKFNVTAKGGLVERSYFDWTTSLPYTILMVLNIAAFGVGLVRLFWWNTDETSTVVMNLIWTAYSLFMLGAAVGVAAEACQVRKMHRVAATLPATLYLPDGRVLHATCTDYSLSGLGLQLEQLDLAQWQALPVGSEVHVGLWWGDCEHAFLAKVMLDSGQGTLGVEFENLSKEQQIALVQCTFARPDSWTHWNDNQEPDRPLLGLQEITHLGAQGYHTIWTALKNQLRDRFVKNRPASAPA